MAITTTGTKSATGKVKPAQKKVVKKAGKRAVTATGKAPAGSSAEHPHLRTARLLEGRSPQLLHDMHQVLQNHGLDNLSIHSIAFSSSSAAPPSGLCPQWRCHTDANGNNVCGWVLEPC